eukprot:12760543-Ditylum_brightwellii.AAC.1
MEEYVGCKIKHNRAKDYMKITQPVLVQSLEDEFDLDEHRHIPITPAEPGKVLSKGEGNPLGKKEHSDYCKGVGKLLHLTRWLRPKIQNAMRECSKMNSWPTKTSQKVMKRVMKYCTST